MFSLIISIISILLVAALALATIYYGGNAFNKGTDEAVASQLINEGQQLQGARTLAAQAADLAATDTVAKLAVNGKYVAQVPAGWDSTTVIGGTTGAFVKDIQGVQVCAAVNTKNGQSGVTNLADVPVGTQFACVTDSTGTTPTYKMHYRF